MEGMSCMQLGWAARGARKQFRRMQGLPELPPRARNGRVVPTCVSADSVSAKEVTIGRCTSTTDCAAPAPCCSSLRRGTGPRAAARGHHQTHAPGAQRRSLRPAQGGVRSPGATLRSGAQQAFLGTRSPPALACSIGAPCRAPPVQGRPRPLPAPHLARSCSRRRGGWHGEAGMHGAARGSPVRPHAGP